MAKKEFDINNIDYKDVIKLMERADDSKRLYEVFTDFIRMIAYSISNAIDPRHYDEREKKYMAIAEKYDKRALDECAKLFAYIGVLLDKKQEDVLGTMYMMLDFGDKNKAQEFTPTSISALLSRICITKEAIQEDIDKKGYTTVSDESCGGGSTIIQYAMTMKRYGFNYQRQLLAIANDLDEIAVAMTYIQLSLLGIPAIVRRQDTLTAEVFETWLTPAFMAQSYKFKDEFRLIENKIEDKVEIICNTKMEATCNTKMEVTCHTKEAKQLELNV